MDFKRLQNWVRDDWQEASHKQPDPHLQLLYLFEELGEMAEAIRKSGGDKTRKDVIVDLDCEMGDLIISIATIANYYSIDLAKAVQKSKQKIIKRHKQGH